MCRNKILFYINLKNRRALLPTACLRALYNETPDEILFNASITPCYVVVGGDQQLEYHPEKADQNAEDMGELFMKQLERFAMLSACRLADGALFVFYQD